MPRILLLLLALGASACDFTPALDIDTPPFEPALTVNAVLFADSTVRVRVTQARDPYATAPANGYGAGLWASVVGASVTLQRNGGPAETLRYRPQTCAANFNPQTGEPRTVECGLFVTDTPVSGGAAYTLRAEAPGLPSVEATARVPVRPSVQAQVTPLASGRGERVALRFLDPAGMGDAYGLDSVVRLNYTQSYPVCDDRGQNCRDTTYVQSFLSQIPFRTSDPVLIAGGRVITNDVSFATFTDQLFDGQERTFVIETQPGYAGPEVSDVRRAVRLIAFDRPLVQAYEQAYFSLGENNPFQEPFDPVSNVRGGFGLVGAAAVTEIDLGEARGVSRR